MLDSKIYDRLGYVSTSVATAPTEAVTVQTSSKPTSVCSTTNCVQYKEATSEELQPPTEYSLLGQPAEYDYVDSTGARNCPYISEHEIEPVLYSSANMVYETAEVHQDVQSGPQEYEVPIGTTQSAVRPREEYSRLKHH